MMLLTDLMNRHHFESVFSDRLSLAERDQSELVFATFDLNGLKRVNDTYGHHAGDIYIKTFAKFMLKNFRKADRFARTGGDEFSAVFWDTEMDAVLKKIKSNQQIFGQIAMVYEA